MKKLIFTLVHLLIFTFAFAQAPQSFEYQAVVRDASGNLLVNQAVGIQITIKQGSATGTSVYQETFNATTNLYGLINLQIGTGTTGDDFTTINWANGAYFLEVAIDVTGGTTYSVMGTSQLLSVPYALHAKTVEVDNVDDADADPTNEIELPSSANVGDVLTWDGSNWIASPKNEGKTYLILSGDITDAEAVIKIANEVGPNTQFVTIQNTTNLTSVDLNDVTELVDLIIFDNENLTTVLCPNLTTIYRDLSIGNNTNLSTLNFLTLSNIVGSINISNNQSLFSLSFQNLETVLTGGINIHDNYTLNTISFPNLTSTTDINLTSNYLASLLIPSISKFNNFDIGFNQFPSIEINNILSHFVAIIPAITGKYINLSGQTPLAPPTGQGVTDKNTLTTNGNTVLTD
ncbi:MAG: hypothetical protein H6587_07700 [Flavobacteriales bacterium]|nr:hypothetical protein [Flavobacteriales bacterium]MCB9364436.1 hypothetical protein [Flavobacteriales bacterium]